MKIRKKIPILLLEDDPLISETLREFLESWDFEVFEGVSVREGLIALEEAPEICLVCMDYWLKDGISCGFATEARRTFPKRRFVWLVMTGGNLPEKDQRFFAELGAEFLMKPFVPDRDLLPVLLRLMPKVP